MGSAVRRVQVARGPWSPFITACSSSYIINIVNIQTSNSFSKMIKHPCKTEESWAQEWIHHSHMCLYGSDSQLHLSHQSDPMMNLRDTRWYKDTGFYIFYRTKKWILHLMTLPEKEKSRQDWTLFKGSSTKRLWTSSLLPLKHVYNGICFKTALPWLPPSLLMMVREGKKRSYKAAIDEAAIEGWHWHLFYANKWPNKELDGLFTCSHIWLNIDWFVVKTGKVIPIV